MSKDCSPWKIAEPLYYYTLRPSPPATILVGRAPWPVADPLVGLHRRQQELDQGSSVDGGVRPTFWLRLAALWGRMASCGRLSIGLPVSCTSLQEGRLTIGLQDSILPHKHQSRLSP